MDFEEMQVIWDSQNERKMYALDTEGLHDKVRRRSRKLGRSVAFEEFGMILICLFIAWNQASGPLLEGTDQYQYIGAALFVGVAAYSLRGRLRRLQHERAFDSTLLGDLNRAIYRLNGLVRRSRTFIWWFMLPAAVLVSISFSQEYDSEPIWPWFFVALSFVAGYAVTQLGLRCSHLPARRDLEALKAKLSEDI